MIWGNFEKSREVLLNIYAEPCWDETSGLSKEELLEGCLKIEKENESNKSIVTKTAMFEYVLDNAQLDVREEDFFPERLNHDNIIFRIRDRWIRVLRRDTIRGILDEHFAAQDGRAYTGNTDLGHCAPDWNAIMTLGYPGLLARVKEAHKGAVTEDQNVFYENAEKALEATIRFIARLADAAEKKGTEKSALVAKSLRNLTVGAPANMLEALQLIVIHYNVQTNVERATIRSLGGLDRLLFPFYKKDIANGTFTDAEIRELFRYFFFKLYSMKVTANIPFYVGGRLPDGSSSINALSYLMIEEYTSLDINDPKIHVRWYDEMPEDFIRLVLTSIRNGRNSFVFVNDNTVEKALIGLGETPEDARNYLVIGCYEPCAAGNEIPCTCAGRANMTKALLTVMTGGVDHYNGAKLGNVNSDPDSYKTFDEFFAAVKAQIATFIDGSMDLIRAYEKYYPTINNAPLLSSTYTSCVEKGADAYDGGAKYNNSSITVFSVATTADALVAVKRLVYDEKRFTLSEFAKILENNWEGNEKLRLEILRTMPKYGNGIAEVDDLAKELVAFSAECVNGKPNGRGGVFRMGLFSIDYRIVFGQKMGATPDGRLAGEMLSKNMGAVTAMDKEGVTALINSVTNIDYTNSPDGTVLDLMLHSSAAEGEEGLTAMSAILKIYMQRGGFALQINVLAPEVLRAAQAEPEKYATLQVRLCGWNVYFTELSKVEQDELIRQCENAG